MEFKWNFKVFKNITLKASRSSFASSSAVAFSSITPTWNIQNDTSNNWREYILKLSGRTFDMICMNSSSENIPSPEKQSVLLSSSLSIKFSIHCLYWFSLRWNLQICNPSDLLDSWGFSWTHQGGMFIEFFYQVGSIPRRSFLKSESLLLQIRSKWLNSASEKSASAKTATENHVEMI